MTRLPTASGHIIVGARVEFNDKRGPHIGTVAGILRTDAMVKIDRTRTGLYSLVPLTTLRPISGATI